MAGITNHRRVKLLDNRVAERPFVSASVYWNYFASELEQVEESWAKAREQAANRGQTAGLTQLEHAHWDWRNKADSVEAERHMLVALECDGAVQGLMAILRFPCRARLVDAPVLYVDYLEVAPWNLKGGADPPRFLGVGTLLVAEAVRVSATEGFEGRVGLHSLPQAEPFYDKCRMTRMGNDSNYFDLVYYEYPAEHAIEWLKFLGETL